MPLPPALAAKLAKRGIVSKKSSSIPGFVEEIIEENYDDEDMPAPPPPPPAKTKIISEYDHAERKRAAEKIAEELTNSTVLPMTKFHRQGHFACPNKTNIFHKCTQYCVGRWGRGIKEPDPRYNKRRLKMLKKFPLPNGWVEIYDAGSGRYYYWEIHSDTVSWRSPRHPKAKLLRPASELRAKADTIKDVKDVRGGRDRDRDRGRGDRDRDRDRDRDYRDDRYRDSRRDDRDRDYDRERDRREDRERVISQLDKYKKEKEKRKRRIVDDLDPMDPSSYSDIPRGTWESGLEKSEARSGVDSTATGPLFQQRPYPSPGAILRANESSKKS